MHALVLQVSGQGQHGLFGKHDERVPLFQIPAQHVGLLLKSQAGVALMADDLELIPAAADHLYHDILRLRGHAEVDFLRPQPQNGSGPVVAPVGFRDHLAFVHHRDVEILVII